MSGEHGGNLTIRRVKQTCTHRCLLQYPLPNNVAGAIDTRDPADVIGSASEGRRDLNSVLGGPVLPIKRAQENSPKLLNAAVQLFHIPTALEVPVVEGNHSKAERNQSHAEDGSRVP